MTKGREQFVPCILFSTSPNNSDCWETVGLFYGIQNYGGSFDRPKGMELCPLSWGDLGGAEAPTGEGTEIGRYRLRQGGR